ncbi:MFS transporter [Streptomyces sp. NBC_00503]|nr:MFS transporter [Streptomyces sp. NBC_00503]
MVLLQVSGFGILLPALQADLHLAAKDLSGLGNAYALAFGALLLLGGHLADLLGRKRMLLAGVVGFAAACALGGAAGDAGALFWARVLQGVFGALLTSSALSLVAAGFTDPKERGRAFGVYAAVLGSGSVLGIWTDGWLLTSLTWRWTFFSGVALAVVALIGVLTLVHESPRTARARLDPLGVVLGSGGLTALTFGLLGAQPDGLSLNLLLLIQLIGGVLLLVAFAWWQSGTSAPVLPADRNRLGAFLAMTLAGMGPVTLLTAVFFHLQYVQGRSLLSAALNLLPMVAAHAVAATLITPWLMRRAAPRVLIVAGLVLMAVGLALLAGLSIGSGHIAPAPGSLVVGLGSGLALTVLFAVATDSAPKHSGGASGLVSAALQLGGAIGTAVLSTAVASRVAVARAMSVPPSMFVPELLHSYSTTLWWASGAALLAAVPTALLITAGRAQRD